MNGFLCSDCSVEWAGGKLFSFVLAVLLLVSPFAFAMEKENQPDDKAGTLIYRAKTPDIPWNGWGFAAPPAPVTERDPEMPREQFDLIVDGSSPRVFSGKVTGPESMKGVEVGLVSLVGIHWVAKGTYQWAPVAADGSFSVTDAQHTDAAKALVVRGPDTPWTFLRYDFKPGEAGRNIVLRAAPGKKVRLIGSGADMEGMSTVSYEVFPAATQRDDSGHALRRQRLGTFKDPDNKYVDAELPLGKVALFIHGEGFAGYYQVIDTRKADRFQFVLTPAGQMKITVFDGEGKPIRGAPVHWANGAAPLSYWEGGSDAKGEVLRGNLVPGMFAVSVAGFGQHVEVAEGQTTEIFLQEGKDPVVWRSPIPSVAAVAAAATPDASMKPPVPQAVGN